MGTQPRAPHHDDGLSAAHGGVRHARRLECVRRPLRVDAGEPHRLRRHADLAPLVVGRGLHLCRQRGVVVLVPKRGIANGADAGEDSLVVEFRASVAEGDPWRWVWSTEGIDDDTLFHPAVIHIDAPEFFHNDFQFRFRSYGSLEGNVDTWHLDYVRVDEDAMTTAPDFEEVAFVTPPASFLTYPWTAMPWPHFEVDPAAYTATSVPTLHRSFGATSNSQEDIGLKVQRVDVLGNVNSYAPTAGAVVNNSVQGLFETDYVDDLQIFTDLFNPALSDSFAVFHVSLWEDEVGAANLTNQIGCPRQRQLGAHSNVPRLLRLRRRHG